MSKFLQTPTLSSRPLLPKCRVIHFPSHTRPWSSLHNQNGLVHIQPVRLKKPPIGHRILKFISRASYVSLMISVPLWYFRDDEEDEKDKSSKTTTLEKPTSLFQKSGDLEPAEEGQHKEEQDEDVQIPEIMPEDAVFIPLGLTRQRPRTFYKGSDPEWQSFIEFRKDQNQELAVRKELVLLVGHHFGGMKSMQKGLGSPMKIRHSWIDVIIPEGPPPEYERSGLEIAENYIAWTTRPISAIQNARLQSALYPLPVAKSFWASFSTSFSLHLAKIKHYLNLEGDSEQSNSMSSSTMVSQEHLQETDASKEPRPSGTDEMSNSKPKEVGNANRSIDTSSQQSSKILSLLPSLLKISNDNGPDVKVFKQTLARNWKPPHDFGERGTLLVTGLVQIEGPKAVCVLDIAAAYHPQESRYTHVACGIRNFRPRNQRPKGGL